MSAAAALAAIGQAAARFAQAAAAIMEAVLAIAQAEAAIAQVLEATMRGVGFTEVVAAAAVVAGLVVSPDSPG